MKRKSKGRKLLISAICLVLVAAIGAGVWFVTANPGGDPVPVFPFLHVGMKIGRAHV